MTGGKTKHRLKVTTGEEKDKDEVREGGEELRKKVFRDNRLTRMEDRENIQSQEEEMK